MHKHTADVPVLQDDQFRGWQSSGGLVERHVSGVFSQREPGESAGAPSRRGCAPTEQPPLLFPQTAVEVFRRMILEVEKMEAGQPQSRTPCSVM